MSEGKDSFEILADELARMGQQIAHLQRTSLNKTEAEALNQQLVQGVASMAQTGQRHTHNSHSCKRKSSQLKFGQPFFCIQQ